jgi:hypothetical protein
MQATRTALAYTQRRTVTPSGTKPALGHVSLHSLLERNTDRGEKGRATKTAAEAAVLSSSEGYSGYSVLRRRNKSPVIAMPSKAMVPGSGT